MRGFFRCLYYFISSAKLPSAGNKGLNFDNHCRKGCVSFVVYAWSVQWRKQMGILNHLRTRIIIITRLVSDTTCTALIVGLLFPP